MKIFKTFMCIAAVAMAFTGCSTDEFEDVAASKNQTISFSSVVTRTAFGEPDGNTYPTLWSGNEKIRVGLNHASNSQATKEAQITTEDNIKASWTAEIEDDGTGSYTFYALSPAAAFNSTRADGWSVKVPEVQTPLDNSCDEAAQILVAKSEIYTEFPSSVSMHFQHFTAYGKLTLKNLNLNGATVQSIALTAEDNIVGRYNYTFASDEIAVNSGSATLTINTDKTEDVWFAIRPCDLATQALKVVVTTDKGTFTKEVEVPEGCAFKAGVIANMTINMEGIAVETPETWSLVTDAAYLAAGDEVVIVAATANYAMSTTQNNNNRGQAAIVKDAENNTVTVGDGVQIFTLEAGTVAGSFAFNTGSGYIYAASSSSTYLRTETTLSANSSWDVTIAADGVATIKAKGTNTRNWLRYNSNSSIFSCYASGQKDVAIYKKGVITPMDIFNVDKTAIEVSDLATSAEFAVSGNVAWTATITEGDATFDNGTTTMTGEGAATVNVNFAANTVAEAKTYKVTVNTDAEVETKSYEVVISQAAATTHAFYVPVTAVTAGKKYLIVANNSGVYYAATPLTSNFGYLQQTVVSVTEEGIMSDDTTDALAFTINASATEGAYNIVDTNGKYYYQTGTYNSFNVQSTLPASGADWTIEIDTTTGLATITNISVSKTVQYAAGYSSYGSYASITNTLPQLYMLQE